MFGSKSLQAYCEAKDFYSEQLCNNEPNRILDFGTGYYGVGRSILTGAKKSADTLYLYDKDTNIETPLVVDNAQIVTEKEVYSTQLDCTHVNLSYVLCTMSLKESRNLLQDLLAQNPTATFFVMDYTLQGQTRQAIEQTLCSAAERQWQRRCGTEEFIRSRSQFSKNAIQTLLTEAGITPIKTKAIDTNEMRIVIAAKPTLLS